MAGSLSHIGTNGDIRGGSRVRNNEPLQRFSEAKKLMGEIFNELGDYVKQLSTFYNGIDEVNRQKFVPDAKILEVERFKESIRTIKEMFGRDKMKVVFFGRTSNGKSTVINSMLHSRVLPAGIGHTTCCFLQVEGGSENETYFMTEGSKDKIPIAELDEAGDALHSNNINLAAMGTDSLLKVYYPKANSKLLQNDVVILDSPGIDVSVEFDGWIDKHCLDADVFVLVCNAESTLSNAEKNFFHRVNQKLSRPNVFILNNRWEISNRENPSRREKLFEQHKSQFIKFLSEELKVCTAAEARNRFFFISAIEMLEARLEPKEEGSKPKTMEEGFNARMLDFQRFESNFERCISKSAVRTKFESHSSKAREINDSLRDNVIAVYTGALHEKQRLSLDYELGKQEIDTCREKFRKFYQKFQSEQKQLRAEVHLKVSADFHEEILRLESIFDRFNHNFNDTHEDIANYKEALAEYAGRILTEDLTNQCTGGLIDRIWKLEMSMYDNAKEILGDQYAQELDKIRRFNKPFKFDVVIDCPNMVRDFHEDLEFRFSLGLESVARRILAITRGEPITAIGHDIMRVNGDRHFERNDVDNFISKVLIQSAAYLANGSIGIAIAGLIVYKNVDWRWIAGGGTLIGAMYAFERYRWNSGAKEERLKDQFRSHLEQRLQQIEHVHTQHCESQAVSELEKVYDGLIGTVSGIIHDMKERVEKTKEGLDKIDGFVKELVTMKGKTTFVSATLDAFATKFFSPDSP